MSHRAAAKNRILNHLPDDDLRLTKHAMVDRSPTAANKPFGPADIHGTRWALAAWIRAPRDRSRDRVILSRGQGGWGHYRLYIQQRFGFLRIQNGNLGDIGCGVVDDGRWHHIAISCDHRTLTFFLDGVCLYAFDIPGGPAASQMPVTLGSLPDGSSPGDVEIQSLVAFPLPLETAQVRQLIDANPHPNPKRISRVPAAPLYEDPLFNSAKDGTIVWNRRERNWWYIYMQIRNACVEPGASIHHATSLGAASSNDGGVNWTYRGRLQGLEWEPGRNTFWAPDIVWMGDHYQALITYVHGIGPRWQGDRQLLRYRSNDLFHWELIGAVQGLESTRSLDGCLYRMPDQMWGLWYKDEIIDRTCFAVGDEQFRFQKIGVFDPDLVAAEGPDVFAWRGSHWLLADDLGGTGGLRVYRSDDCRNWRKQPCILGTSGTRSEDVGPAKHAEVVVSGDNAYVFYWTSRDQGSHEDARQLCVLQVAKLQMIDGQLACDRNADFELNLADGAV